MSIEQLIEIAAQFGFEGFLVATTLVALRMWLRHLQKPSSSVELTINEDGTTQGTVVISKE